MEDFRAVRYIAITAIIFAVFIGSAYSWDNYKVHPEMNKLAYDKFVNKWMPEDTNLAQASLSDSESEGEAWDLDMGADIGLISTALPLPVASVDKISYNYKHEDRKKTIENWLNSGGFSADEPEAPQSLRHFYDPEREPHYLTDVVNDAPWIKEYNPKITALEWAFSDKSNPYSFPNAREYFKEAIGMPNSPGNIMYGKAWRAVGETMHLISDMTVPAHVRNDCHIPFSKYTRDPFEYYTTDTDVDLLGSEEYSPSNAIDYKRTYPGQGDLSSLMHDVAKWTNNNFFSADTLPLEGKTTTFNDENAYPLPAVNWPIKSQGYYYGKVGGQEIPLAKISLKSFLWASAPKLELDSTVWRAYQKLLIPTAIEASASVLDAFLPRFEVKIDSVNKDPSDSTQYVVEGSLNLIKTNVWQDSSELIVRNGATLKIKSKNTGDETSWPLRCPEKGDLNKIIWKGQIDSGDEVTLEYNLGGYTIKSKPYKLETTASGCDWTGIYEFSQYYNRDPETHQYVEPVYGPTFTLQLEQEGYLVKVNYNGVITEETAVGCSELSIHFKGDTPWPSIYPPTDGGLIFLSAKDPSNCDEVTGAWRSTGDPRIQVVLKGKRKSIGS